jgi:hypothetical protein
MKKVGIILILAVLTYFGIYASLLLKFSKSTENYLFLSYIILLFVIIYCVSVLKYKITGSTVGVEETLKEINTSKSEIKTITESFIKITYILADGIGSFGGFPDEHKNEISSIQKSLKDYLNPNLDKEIIITIDKINKEIKARIEKDKKV